MNAWDRWLSRRTRAQCWAMVGALYIPLLGAAIWEVFRG
jgi:hypothetical protein